MTVAVLAEKTGSTPKEVLGWSDEHFAISQAAFSALGRKRNSETGSAGPGGPTP